LSPASSRIDASILLKRPGLSALLSALTAIPSAQVSHEEARIVGGAVRDLVMGRKVGDVDVATTALPEAVVRMAERQGWKAVPTGIEHGTVTIVIEGTPYEVTTLRRDIETDGRHAVVHFTRDFREDAERRDFTVNALSMSADGTVHDTVGGVADARAGLIRFVGEPSERIAEDYLRILRFYRFLASHGRGAGDAAARAACRAMHPGLPRLSRERIGQELRKLLIADRAGEVAGLMAEDGVLTSIVGTEPARPDALQRLIALEKMFDVATNWINRLAALTAEPKLSEELRLSRLESSRLQAMRKQASALIGAVPGLAPLATAALATSSEIARSSLLLALALKPAAELELAIWKKATAQLEAQTIISPYKALDFDKLGVPVGPRRGAVVNRANALWIEAGMPTGRTERKALLMRALAEV
jgi:poly(A) polymerase